MDTPMDKPTNTVSNIISFPSREDIAKLDINKRQEIVQKLLEQVMKPLMPISQIPNILAVTSNGTEFYITLKDVANRFHCDECFIMWYLEMCDNSGHNRGDDI